MSKEVLILIRTNHKSEEINWVVDKELGKISRCLFSSYGDVENIAAAAGGHYFSGGKWSGIFDFFKGNTGYINEFEYFWFPDDDIRTKSKVAIDFLEIVREQDFKLAQPALNPDSHYADRITIQNPAFKFRRTNFVELMMPIMHRSVLKRLLPLFECRHAALGLDFFWHQLTDNPRADVAIVDATPMGHYRPRKKHLKSNMSKMEIDIQDERNQTFQQFEISRQMPTILSGETIKGVNLERGPSLWKTYYSGLRKVQADIHYPKWSNFQLFLFFLQQATSNQNISCFNRFAYNEVISQFEKSGKIAL